MDSVRWFIVLGSINAFLAIGAGAFGAHALRGSLAPNLLEAFQTGAHYHLIHALALTIVGLLADRWPSTAMTWAGSLLLLGIVLFSGSLYAMAITRTSGLGIITPFGGTAFMAGWVLLAVAAWRRS